MDAAPPGTMAPATREEDTAPGLPPGTIIAERYRVEELLGEGGMGAVYRAEHVHMRKQVAVKVLHRSMSSTDEIVARFEREAVAAGNISHPNVAAATDFGKLADGSFFLVLEYIDGQSLRSLLNAEGRVTPDRALRIVSQIAGALGAAHAKGVVHRDLKPENVMLVARPGEEELVKVLDFGIAKIDIDSVGTSSGTTGPSSAQPLTRVGAVFGTPDYMAPEQAVGQAVDGRADLYAIGVMLYEMLAGQRPYRGGTVTVLRQHVLHEIPPLPTEVLTQVDPRVGALVNDLLAKTPDLRVPTAQDLQDRVGVLLTQPSPPVPLAAPSRPSPMAVLPTSVAANGIAVSAPTAMAIEGSPAAPGVVLAETARGSSAPHGVSRTLLFAVGGGALLIGLLGVGSWLAFRGSPSDAAPAASASATSHVDPGVVLPPPPGPEKRSAAAAQPTTTTASAEATNNTAAPSTTEEPSDPARAGSGGASSTSSSHGKGHPKEKEGRKTGPGGIYIPPPKDWFN